MSQQHLDGERHGRSVMARGIVGALVHKGDMPREP